MFDFDKLKDGKCYVIFAKTNEEFEKLLKTIYELDFVDSIVKATAKSIRNSVYINDYIKRGLTPAVFVSNYNMEWCYAEWYLKHGYCTRVYEFNGKKTNRR